jgi:hypothetical protein
MKKIGALLLFVFISLNLFSQKVIKSGTELVLKNLKDIDSEKLDEGDRVFFMLNADYFVDGKKVLRKGLEAIGTVNKSKESTLLGRGELKLSFDLLYLEDGRGIKLKGETDAKGTFSTFHLLTPKDPKIKKGNLFKVVVSEDFTL